MAVKSIIASKTAVNYQVANDGDIAVMGIAIYYMIVLRVSDGYVWLGGTDSNGTRIYIPVGPNDGDKTIFGDWLLGMTYLSRLI